MYACQRAALALVFRAFAFYLNIEIVRRTKKLATGRLAQAPERQEY